MENPSPLTQKDLMKKAVENLFKGFSAPKCSEKK